MQSSRNFLHRLAISSIGILILAASAFAQSSPQPAQSAGKIKNFGQMDERFFRGARPKEADIQALKALGINTIIDLQAETRDYEKAAVEALGMRYINIPIDDKAYPTQESVDAFLKLVNDPSTGKFYVHCAGGRHRTGIMGAVYRFTNYKWNYDQVYKEMKDYDFYSSWGHGDQKKFVQDYWSRIQAAPAAHAVTTESK